MDVDIKVNVAEHAPWDVQPDEHGYSIIGRTGMTIAKGVPTEPLARRLAWDISLWSFRKKVPTWVASEVFESLLDRTSLGDRLKRFSERTGLNRDQKNLLLNWLLLPVFKMGVIQGKRMGEEELIRRQKRYREQKKQQAKGPQ